jgi:hypothetical protein
MRQAGQWRLIVVWLLDSAPPHPGTEEAATTKLWYYMAGGGWGGPVIIPHPNNNDARSTNANDKDDAPPPPPQKTMAMPHGGRAMGSQWCRDNDAMAAAASRDAVAANAMSMVGCWGARNLCAAADGMGGFMIMCLVLFDCRVGLGHDGGLDGGRGAGRRRTIRQ